MNYEENLWRKPTMDEEDKEIFSEHGRALNGVCYRAYWLVLVSRRFGGYNLLVKHGGGEERIDIGFMYHGLNHVPCPVLTALESLDSDTRFLTLFFIYRTSTEGYRKGVGETKRKYNNAFINGKLKKKKVRGENAYSVSISP